MASLREVIEKAKYLVAQSERNEAWHKRCKSSNSDHHKKVKRQVEAESHTDLISIDNKIDSFEIATKLRQQVSKWQKAQSDIYLKNLKEHEHFEIKLNQSAQTGASNTSVSVKFICLICNKSIPMSTHQNSGSYVLSNCMDSPCQNLQA